MRLLAVLALLTACGPKPVPEKPLPTKPVVGDDDGEGSAGGPSAIEDEDDEDFEIEGQLGRVSDAEVQRNVEQRSAELAGCYDKNMGQLRYLGGQLELTVRVGADGKVAGITTGGDLGAWPIEKCALGVVRQMTFSPPKGGKEAQFSFPISYPPRGGQVTDLDAETAESELTAKLRDLKSCAGTPGEVAVTVYAAAGGTVTSAGFAGTVADGWADCALARALKWKLTDPRGKVVRATAWFRP
jgi:hypothetical protein